MLVRFLKDRRGSVAPLMAIAAIPLMGSVGMAIDYTRATTARSAFQAALDSTALKVSLEVAKATTPPSSADLQNMATTYFNALFTQTKLTAAANSTIPITSTYSTTGGSKIVLNGNTSVPTKFLGILGVNQIDIGATSTATWGNTRLRVSLVLDNTGSMSQSGKMTALQTAAKNLLNQLQTAATSPDDVYVSIVPFAKDVNIDPANVNAAWLRWDLWEALNGTCSNSSYNKQSKCTANGGIWTPASHSIWNGCITDRDQNFDTTNDAPMAGATLFPTEQYSSCPVATMGLTNDWTSLSNKITAMQPKGNTNQAIGLQVGWQSLTASPFTVPAMDPNYKYNQVIILLTDGLNTQDRWYSNASSIDAREQMTCDNIKAAGITLYTVQVNTDGAPTSTLLQNCASDSSKFFLLTTSDEIVTTFNQIGTALSNLRLAN